MEKPPMPGGFFLLLYFDYSAWRGENRQMADGKRYLFCLICGLFEAVGD